MYAVVANTPDTIANSSTDAVSGDGPLAEVEARFIEVWAQLSSAFGMGDDMGRVHAAIYLSDHPLTMAQVAVRLGMSVGECADAIDRLVDYGAISAGDGQVGGATAWVSEQDPWTWFMGTIRRRAALEFMPLLRAIKEVRREAKLARKSGKLTGARFERIERFGGFVEQISGMLETLGNFGGGSMFAVRAFARFMPR